MFFIIFIHYILHVKFEWLPSRMIEWMDIWKDKALYKSQEGYNN